MQYLFMTIFAAGIIAADQLSKLWVVQEIQMYEQVPAIQGLFHLTHVHNYGAAWSSFQGMIWLFALIFGIFTLAIIWEFLTKKMGFTTLERWCIAAVWGGGMGNMIDLKADRWDHIINDGITWNGVFFGLSGDLGYSKLQGAMAVFCNVAIS